MAKILSESEDSADELPSSNRGDTGIATSLEEQKNSLVFNRPPPPKYDEAYQFTVQSQHRSTESTLIMYSMKHDAMTADGDPNLRRLIP